MKKCIFAAWHYVSLLQMYFLFLWLRCRIRLYRDSNQMWERILIRRLVNLVSAILAKTLLHCSTYNCDTVILYFSKALSVPKICWSEKSRGFRKDVLAVTIHSKCWQEFCISYSETNGLSSIALWLLRKWGGLFLAFFNSHICHVNS